MKTLSLLLIASLGLSSSVKAQTDEAAQLLLNWEKLQQLEAILENMYVGYKVLDKGYRTIKDISEGNYSIHQAFLDGLMAVNPSVRNYKRIPLIINYQKLLLDEYKRAFVRFKNDPNFTVDEVIYLGNVYSFLFKQSLRNLDELAMVITATSLRMTDDERMEAIDRVFFDVENKVMFLRQFNNSTQLLAIQRARENSDATTLRKLYGVDQ
jgi:hypothetical protein